MISSVQVRSLSLFSHTVLLVAICSLVSPRLLSAQPSSSAQEKKAPETKAPKQLMTFLASLAKKYPKQKLLASKSGVKYLVLKPGTGEKVGKGKKIKAHYTGTFPNGKKFDSSRDRGEPIAFTVGVGRLNLGLDEALSDMKVGEQRILVIPPELAYGKRGAGNVIPPNATLVFDVELVSIDQ